MISASASSISRNVSHETVRISLRSPCSSSYGHVRSASAISSWAASQRASRAGAERLAREREQADAVGHLLPHERNGHDEVLVGAQVREGGKGRGGSERLAQPGAWLAGQQALGVALGDVAALRLARCERAELEEELGLRPDGRVVGRVGAVHHLLGRGLGEQRAHIERVPERGVEADAGMAQRADRMQVGDRAVGEHHLCPRVALEQPCEIARQRRDRAPRVEQHRHAPLGGEREGVVQLGMREIEPGQARVQLDALRAGVERSGQLVAEALARLAPAERRDAAAARGGRAQHLGVRSRIAGARR